jgi:hypothetical protein
MGKSSNPLVDGAVYRIHKQDMYMSFNAARLNMWLAA